MIKWVKILVVQDEKVRDPLYDVYVYSYQHCTIYLKL